MFVLKRKVVNNMNNKEFMKALDALVNEKGISKDYILEALELALTSAYKKNYHSLSNVRVSIDEDDIKVYSFKTVVLDREHAVSLDEEDKLKALNDRGIMTDRMRENIKIDEINRHKGGSVYINSRTEIRC